MRPVVYDVAVSIDGFISGVDGDISMFPAEGDHVTAYLARLQSYGAVVMGRRTYEFGYRYGLAPGARAYPHMDHYVFSRTMATPEGSEISPLAEEAVGFVSRLKQGEGGAIYLCGGGELAGALLAAGLIDRLILKKAPIVIGEGARLFGDHPTQARFKVSDVTQHQSGVMTVTMDLA